MNKLIILFFLFLIAVNCTKAHPGIGIVMDSEGNVFYTDLSHVWKISTDGKRTIAVRDVHTHELYLDANDNLYGEHEWYEGKATDKWGNYVWRLTKEGVLSKVIPDVEGFLANTTLIRDTNGNSYWTRKNGKKEVLMKSTVNGQNFEFSSHQFNDIRWMHFSPYDNNLYVVDLITIKRVKPTGKVEVIAKDLKENKPSFMGLPDHHYIFGLWTDRQKNIFIASYGAQQVKKINPSGEVSTEFTSSKGWSPCGGLIAKDGKMWILEFSSTNKTRVRKIIPDGEDVLFGG